MSEADVLYIGAASCDLYRYGVSMNNVYDYLMAGKPVVYGVKTFNNDIDGFGCGISAVPDNPNKIVFAIKNPKYGVYRENRNGVKR